MERLICFALAGTLAGISGCSRQEKDTPKQAVIDKPQAQEKDPPKPPGIDTPQAKENSPPKIIVTDPPKLPEPYTNSIGMKFVWIPPGNFVMGSPKEEKLRNDNETQHKVTLTKGFYMGVYTVTQEEWQAVMGKNPSWFKGEKNLPVEQVPWDDCQEFIKKLREKDKKPYRLPTEAEWEYACRAGSKHHFPLAKRFPRTRQTTTTTSPMAMARKVFIERKPRQSAASPQMLGGCTTCTAMFGSGVRTGMVIIHKKKWLTRRGQKRAKTV